MSKTLATVILNSRTLLRDTNASDYIISSDRLLHMATSKIHFVAGKLDLGVEWVSAIVTLATDDYDYALANTYEYKAILAVRRAQDGEILEKVTPLVLQAFRQGENLPTGETERYALLEVSPSSVAVATATMLIDPAPSSAESGHTLDALVSYEPQAEATSSSDVIPFTNKAIRATELLVCVGAMAELTQDDLGRVRLQREAANDWLEEANALIADEQLRIHRQKRPDGILLTEA